MGKAYVAIVLGLCLAGPAHAASPIATKNATAHPKPAKPEWSALTSAQQSVLAPLKDDWSELDSTRRAKWVKVANRYPKMKPEERERLQARMKEWANLSTEERRAIRQKYLAIKKMPPSSREQLKVQWQQYQQSLVAKPDTKGEITPASNPQ